MNRSPWRLEEVDRSPWRLEEADGGDEQYPVESHFAVRHTPPDHLLTKLTTTCVGFDLLSHISASKNVTRIQPIFIEFTVFFSGVEFTVNLIFF